MKKQTKIVLSLLCLSSGLALANSAIAATKTAPTPVMVEDQCMGSACSLNVLQGFTATLSNKNETLVNSADQPLGTYKLPLATMWVPRSSYPHEVFNHFEIQPTGGKNPTVMYFSFIAAVNGYKTYELNTIPITILPNGKFVNFPATFGPNWASNDGHKGFICRYSASVKNGVDVISIGCYESFNVPSCKGFKNWPTQRCLLERSKAW